MRGESYKSVWSQLTQIIFQAFLLKSAGKMFVHQTSQIRMARNSVQTATLLIKTGRKLHTKVSLYSSPSQVQDRCSKVIKMRSTIIFLACIILFACFLQNATADDGKLNENESTDVWL